VTSYLIQYDPHIRYPIAGIWRAAKKRLAGTIVADDRDIKTCLVNLRNNRVCGHAAGISWQLQCAERGVQHIRKVADHRDLSRTSEAPKRPGIVSPASILQPKPD
jgi:hypothetical protein